MKVCKILTKQEVCTIFSLLNDCAFRLVMASLHSTNGLLQYVPLSIWILLGLVAGSSFFRQVV